MQVENPGVREIEMTLEVISLLSTVVPSDSFTSKQQQRFESLKDVDERMDYYTVLIQLTVEGKMGLAYFLIQQIIDEIGEDAAVDEVAIRVVGNEIESMDTLVEMIYYIIRVLTKFVRRGGISGRSYRMWVVKPEILALARKAIESWASVCGVDIEYFSDLAKMYASK